MRLFLLMAALCSVTVCFGADSVTGTITLEKNDDVVFRFSGGQTKYEGSSIPGMRVLGFSKMSKVKDDKEMDISELILELTSGERITLVQGKPESIIRTRSGKAVEWHTEKK